jgi:hypothetical protein
MCLAVFRGGVCWYDFEGIAVVDREYQDMAIGSDTFPVAQVAGLVVRVVLYADLRRSCLGLCMAVIWVQW